MLARENCRHSVRRLENEQNSEDDEWINSNLVDGGLKLLFEFVEMVDFVLLGGEVGLSLLDRLFESLLVLAQLGHAFVLFGQLAVQRLDLVVLGLLLLLRLHTHHTDLY